MAQPAFKKQRERRIVVVCGDTGFAPPCNALLPGGVGICATARAASDIETTRIVEATRFVWALREAVVPLSVLQTPRGANPESTVTPLMVLTIVTRSEASPESRVPARQAFCRLRTKSLAELGGIRITDKSPCTSRIAAEIR